MYTATFTFRKKQFDNEFHRLDDAIARVARSIGGYFGEEAWESGTAGLVSTVYYWSSLDALNKLYDDVRHLEAKARNAEWIGAYRVVIAEVVREYGTLNLFMPAGSDAPEESAGKMPSARPVIP